MLCTNARKRHEKAWGGNGGAWDDMGSITAGTQTAKQV